GEEEVLFDPFHGGRRLELLDCENLVRQVTGMEFQATAASVRSLALGPMVQRMLNNLKGIYLGGSDFRRGVRIIQRLQQLEPRNPLHERDLGSSLLRLGQPGAAVDHLQAYLDARPAADDAEQVRQLLRAARGQIARWN